MIYRIVGEDFRTRDIKNEDGWIVGWERATGKLCGAMLAGFGGWDDLPAPRQPNPRARFWFTERGWKRYGRYILADAVKSGRRYRLLVQKNPPESRIAYKDKWQVALLPPGKK